MANNIIVINRGDSFDFSLNINDADSETGIYYLQEDDVVYFGLMDPHRPFEEALIKKRVTVEDMDPSGNIFFKILPEDTLDLLPGVYYYAVKLKMDHNLYNPETWEIIDHIDAVQTVINKTKFIICD